MGQLIVLDHLLYLTIFERLLRLRLPGQDAIFRDTFVKDMAALLLSKGHEQDKVPRTVGDGHDAL